MNFESFEFENYKSFRTRQRLDVRPLTLLIGRNNCGKSAIARLPVLLARGLAGKEDGPLALDAGGITFGSAISDLIHNKTPHGRLGFQIEISSENTAKAALSWRLQHYSEYRMFIITEFEVTSEGEQLKLTWVGKDPLKEPDVFRINNATEPKQGIFFRGLLPTDLVSLCTEKMGKALEPLLSVSQFEQSITYLGPFREPPKRYYDFPSGQRQDVGHAGEKTADLLGSDFLRQRGKILRAVGQWYEQHMNGWRLDLNSQNGRFSLILCDPANPAVEINIADTGTGIAQVLPLVVQRLFEASSGQGKLLDIVEQPELHLHPAAHGSVADLYIDAIQHSKTRFLIETHSENFLLRIQLRMAEKKLRPEDVIIHWVEKGTTKEIKLDEQGELDSWPKGVFSEDYDETIRIRQAQRRHKK